MLDLVHTPSYDKNARKAGKHYPCCVCGKGIANPSYHVRIHCGGDCIVTAGEAATMDPAGDLYYYPIGADCLRRHPEYKPYAVKANKR